MILMENDKQLIMLPSDIMYTSSAPVVLPPLRPATDYMIRTSVMYPNERMYSDSVSFTTSGRCSP